MLPIYQSLLHNEAFFSRIKSVSDFVYRSPAFEAYRQTMIGASLPAIETAARAIGRSYPLQNWPSIVSTHAWAQASSSFRSLVDILPTPQIGAWVDSLRLDHYPPNWPDDLLIKEVRELADDEGIPLCWVPRAEVVDALRSADPTEQRDVLLKHREDVLDEPTGGRGGGEVVAPGDDFAADGGRQSVVAVCGVKVVAEPGEVQGDLVSDFGGAHAAYGGVEVPAGSLFDGVGGGQAIGR